MRPAVATSPVETIVNNTAPRTDELQDLLNPTIRQKHDDKLDYIKNSLMPLRTRSENPRFNELMSLDDVNDIYTRLQVFFKYNASQSDDDRSQDTEQGDSFQAYVNQMVQCGSSF